MKIFLLKLLRLVLGFFFSLTLFFAMGFHCQAQPFDTKLGFFSGWVSSVNREGRLIRFKIDFNNFKYINKNDLVEIWNEGAGHYRCKSYVVGKTNTHMLVKIPELEECRRFVHFATGAIMRFYGADLVNNLKMGKHVTNILLKKHLALSGQLGRQQKELDAYLDKMNAINGRYQVLREKLEQEWQTELSALEEDRLDILKDFALTQKNLDEVKFKLEQYRVDDDHLTLDRWSLDSKQYIRR